MALSPVFLPSQTDRHVFTFNSEFLPCVHMLSSTDRNMTHCKKRENLSFYVTCSTRKIVRDRVLDRQVSKQNSIRFVQKLRTLLLSKPKHYMPLHILSKCRDYLSLPKPRSILAMIHRYPTIFELFTIPTPSTPMNATKLYDQLCVRLTPAAEALATQEANLKLTNSITLASKLQKLLMLSSHRRLVLSKLVHLGQDLGLPPNFRSRLCNEHPERFKTVDTSYGRALELVSWDPDLASPLPKIEMQDHELIVDRPLKFKQLKLRKGLNLKRCHQEYLIKFGELSEICPYKTPAGEFSKASIEAEKRACSVVREVLGMTIEKRTLVDHLTHFRKDFGLPNKLRGMLVRHPELFYVSLKGQRDSVILVEAYDDNGALIETDESLRIKDRLLDLIRLGKRIRRERRKAAINSEIIMSNYTNLVDHQRVEEVDEYYQINDVFNHLFDGDDSDFEICEDNEPPVTMEEGNFWTAEATSRVDAKDGGSSESW
ncbi:hypothetical protein Ancab_031239 [Ancistrocladus abbreviatus]